MKGYAYVFESVAGGAWRWSITVPRKFQVRSLPWRQYSSSASAAAAMKKAASRCGIEIVTTHVDLPHDRREATT